MGKIFGTMPLVGKTSLGVEPIVSPYLFLGFGLHLLWLCAVVYQSFPSYYVADPQTAAMYSEVGIVTLFAAITTLMVMGWLIDRITYYIRLHKVQIVIAAIMAASTAMLFVAQFVTLYPLLIGGGFVAGASGAFITLIWAEAFRRRDSISIVMNTILALLTALMGFGLMFWTVPRHLHGLVLSLVPLLSLAGLFMVMHGIKAFKGNQEFTIDTDGNKLPVYGVRELPTFRRLRVGKRQFLARIGVPSLLLGLSYGTFSIRTMSVVNHLDVTDLGVGAVFISASVIALFLVVLLLALIDEAELGGFFRFMLPVLVVIMITLTMVEGELPPLFFSFLAFVLFSAIIWISYCELSHRYRISPILVLGFGLGVLIIGQLLAEMLISLGGAMLPAAAFPYTIYAAATVLMLAGFFSLPSEADIRNMSIVSYEDGSEDKPLEPVDRYSEAMNEKLNRGRFVERCERAANTFLLTNRETDLLYLLAKGRNASHIAKQLFISEGTVHTHTWHIYRKLDVHTQQELIDLVDSIDRS